MYYMQPPSSYDQTKFDLLGDYDLFGHPGDEWRYYLVSGFSADLTAEPAVAGIGPFSVVRRRPTRASRSRPRSTRPAARSRSGYVIVKGVLQWPNVNIKAETFADVRSTRPSACWTPSRSVTQRAHPVPQGAVPPGPVHRKPGDHRRVGPQHDLLLQHGAAGAHPAVMR